MPFNPFVNSNPFADPKEPVFEPYDPYAAQREELRRPLLPEEEETILGRLGHSVLGGVGYVGGLLDKFTGGRAIRGVLGGKPQELLSIIPGSDTLFGWTNRERDEVRGSDLLRQWNMIDSEDSWLNMGAGIAAELALSPITYLSFGSAALTPAGRTAQKIGALPSGTRARIQGLPSLTNQQMDAARALKIKPSEVLNQPLGGVAAWGLPFMQGKAFGTGARGEAFLDLLGAVGRGLSHLPGAGAVQSAAESTGRYLGGIFNPLYRGQTSAAGQAAAKEYSAGMEAGMEAMRGTKAQLVRDADAAGLLDQPDVLRGVGEGTMQAPSQAAVDINLRMRAAHDALDQRARSLGFSAGALTDDEIEYVSRFASKTKAQDYTGPTTGNLFNTKPSQLQGRADALKNVPGGTEAINKMSLDPMISGTVSRLKPTDRPTRLAAADHIRQTHFNMTPQDIARANALQAQITRAARSGLTPPTLSAQDTALLNLFNKADDLVPVLAKLPKEHIEQSVPLFGNNPLVDWETAQVAKIQRVEAAEAVQGLFANQAVSRTAAGPGYISLKEALQSAGFDDVGTALSSTISRNKNLQGLNHTEVFVPAESATAAARFVQGFAHPKSLDPLLKAADWFTNLTKTYQTVWAPAFHFRNFISGQWQNLVMGAFSNQGLQDAAALITKNGVVKGAKDIKALKAMGFTSDSEATKALADMAYQFRATGSGAHATKDLTGLPGTARVTRQAQDMREAIPGMEGWRLEGKGAKLSEGGWNPLNVAGVNRIDDEFIPVATMRNIGGGVEDLNRLSAFMTRLRQGYDPRVAAAEVRAAHVDYSALSPVERQLFRRVIPFYSYTRQTLPWTLQKLVETPGGLTGMTARGISGMREDPDTFVPAYLGGGLALPLGTVEDGRKRYLTRTDLPVESAFEPIKGDLSQSGMSLLGQMNPLIKGPLEYLTGKQFYTGRELGDLQPVTGSLFTDTLMMNSPLSRVATTARTIADPAKWQSVLVPGVPEGLVANLLTGLRVSDIDVEKQKDIQARELIRKYLQGNPDVAKYEAISPRADQIQNLSPWEVALLRLDKNLEQRSKERAEERKQGRIGIRQ